MLNKYTLEFLFKDQAQQYLTHSRNQILREVTSLSIYASLFAVLNIIKFSMMNSIPYIVLSVIALILILSLWKLLEKKPNALNIVVTIYQLFLLAAFKLPEMMSEYQDPTDNQAWYYGFQCGYLHFSVYLLSANFIYQTTLLVLVIGTHLVQNSIGSQEGIINVFLFVSMLFSMVAIKYHYEKTRRVQYFQSLQQEKWEQLLTKALSSSVILISHDKKQDQLLLEKENKVSSNLFHFQDSGNMRSLFRQVFLKQIQLIVTSNREQEDRGQENFNMEFIIRKFLTKTQEYTDSFKAYKYLVKHSETQKLFNVKILRCVFNNQLQCLVIFDSKKILQCNQNQVLWSILRNVSEAALEQSCVLLKIIQKINEAKNSIQGNEKYLTNHFNHNFFQNVLHVFQQQQWKPKFETISQSQLQATLLCVGFKNLKIEMNKSIVHNLQIIQQLLVTCMQILKTIFKQQDIKFKIQIMETDDEIEFSISVNQLPIKSKIIDIIQNNWIKSPKAFFHKTRIHQHLLERMGFLMKQLQVPLDLLLNISITQMILSQFGVYNHLNVINDENEQFTIKFSLLHQIKI